MLSGHYSETCGSLFEFNAVNDVHNNVVQRYGFSAITLQFRQYFNALYLLLIIQKSPTVKAGANALSVKRVAELKCQRSN